MTDNCETDITFDIIYPDTQKGAWGSKENPSIYVGLTKSKFEKSVKMMQKPDEIVIDKPRIRVLFNYPLRGDHIIQLNPPSGAEHFTRAELAEAIAKQYQKIYQEESETTTRPEETIRERVRREAKEMPEDTIAKRTAKKNATKRAKQVKLINRARTDGEWGIWGHELADLDLHTVSYHPDKDLYTLGIDS